MPALRLFGRKWLVASDDFVYPGIFEIVFRSVWLVLVGVACARYYGETWRCRAGGELVRVFLVGKLCILGGLLVLAGLVVRHSARGSITDGQQARRWVEPLLTLKVLAAPLEACWTVLGSLWLLGSGVQCARERFTLAVLEALVLFDWLLLGLALLATALAFDPLRHQASGSGSGSADAELQDKLSRIWLRRVKLLWWMRNDETADETFQHVAGLLSALFQGTDLVPSDVVAGCVLLRVRQKRESHQLRLRGRSARAAEAAEDAEDLFASLFADCPGWMSLDWAHHFMQLSIASYGWLFLVYRHACTGCSRLLRGMRCCSCLRSKRNEVLEDNCCMCSMSGVKSLGQFSEEDILFASFRNHLCEIPFFVLADHKTSSIAIVIRGSLSLRDLITDIAAASDSFEPEGLPPGSMAHKGMIVGAKVILRQLEQHKVLENAFKMYPHYQLTLTGHSLGAGLAVLLGILLRPRYPKLRVYAFATPAGLLSRDAARVTEEFVLTIGLGDDLVMRLSVDSIENFRTSLLIALEACRLPKYRVVLNGFGYMLFGVPERDLERTWRNGHNAINSMITPVPGTAGHSPLLAPAAAITVDHHLGLTTMRTNANESVIDERDVARRRYSKVRLFTAGKILHIVRSKPAASPGEKKKRKMSKNKDKNFQMRWAQAEEFMELLVMPRMLLDHLPENLEDALTTLVQQQQRHRHHQQQQQDLSLYLEPL